MKPIKKQKLLIWILLLTCNPIYSQYKCGYTKSYLPEDTTFFPIINIRLAIHIVAKSDSSGNFKNIEEHKKYIKTTVLNHVNWFFVEPKPTVPYDTLIYENLKIKDTRVRCRIDTILFHYSDTDWDYKSNTWYVKRNGDTGFNAGVAASKTRILHRKYVKTSENSFYKDSLLHCFFVEALNFQDRGQASGINNKDWNYVVGFYHNYNKAERNHWIPSGHLVHEILHNLGLEHYFSYNTCYDIPRNSKTGATSNRMDYWPNANMGFTNCQVETITKNLYGVSSSLSDVCFPDMKFRNTPIKVRDSLIFEGKRYINRDLVVKKGGVLQINCDLVMNNKAVIILEEGATLIANNPKSKLVYYTNNEPIKIFAFKPKKILFFFSKKTRTEISVSENIKVNIQAIKANRIDNYLD